MVQALPQVSVSFDAYLASERDAGSRGEYISGEVFAMARTNELHNTITGDFCARINVHLPEQCRVWQSDMKVVGKTQDQQPFSYYPDIMAACEDDPDGDPYYRTNPLLIVEVLSRSTRRTDLKEKLDSYSQIDTLLEYVVVSQDTPWVRVYRRRNHWQLETFGAEQ